ncbi:M20 aminoacylase family protein [Paraburkholderia sp.]|uniref:M20 aminoacylase family protein n=1 Tax=Paraburkholderia sp. TaxID=1926495 RepID=UPI0039E455F5
MDTPITIAGSTDYRDSLREISQFDDDLRGFRRDLHAHPELGFREERTARLIAETLRQSGFDEVHTQIGRTGVVGVLQGAAGRKSVALRADMDALPIQETTDVAHRSVHTGLMHGCGHDGHVAMLLGAARYLACKRNFRGKVTFVFQPGEEGYAGAREMIEDGLFERFPIDEIYALHNWPSLPVGTVAINAGPMMAARDDFWIRIHGVGGHGAIPHKTIDPIVVCAAVVNALQSIVSRNVDPGASAVLTLHSVSAGTVIEPGLPTQSVTVPSAADLAGIAKWFDEATGKLIRRRIEEVARNCAAAFGAHAEVTYLPFLPPTVNHAVCSQLVVNTACDLLGTERVLAGIPPGMASEDFSFMLQAKPGAYFWLGVGEAAHSLHSSNYDFNDTVLATGAALLASIAQRALEME